MSIVQAMVSLSTKRIRLVVSRFIDRGSIYLVSLGRVRSAPVGTELRDRRLFDDSLSRCAPAGRHVMQPQLLGAGPRYGVQDQAGGEHRDRYQQQHHRKHPGRHAGNQPRAELFDQHRRHENQARCHESEADQTKEGEGSRFLHQHCEHPEDLGAVAVS